LPGWNFPIREKPARGEYRYLRFAWKKVGGNGVMLQLCGDDYRTINRYLAGTAKVPWQALKIADQPPTERHVVTRDLFKDFGSFVLMGLAFTPMDGDAGLFDHMYLGRTLEDLEKVKVVSGKGNANVRQSARDLENLWKDLKSRDAAVNI